MKYNKYLGPKGYSIRKEILSVDEQVDLREELTVKAFVPKNSIKKSTPFPIYRESKHKFYVPRFYGNEKYGITKKSTLGDGDPINIEFKGQLRPYQKPIVETYLKKSIGGGLLEVAVGYGKCLAKGTPIMMSNGEIKKVENIKVSDTLMGDDSKPRTVLSLARGREMMYEIKPTKGDSYIVNESHILSLRCSFTKGKYKKNQIIDICVKDYLKLPKYVKKNMLKGYKVPVDFPEKNIDLDPYILGCWLGDGTSRLPQITSVDEEIIKSFKTYSKTLGLDVRRGNGRDKITYTATYGKKNRKGFSGSKGKNPMLNLLRKYNVLNNKHIPLEYKCNSRNIRLQLLAGIIDTDGSLMYNGCYDIIQKNEKLLDDIIYVARSLGFAAYKKECKKSCMYKGEKRTGIYYRTTIHGEGLEEIPVKLERKKSRKRRQKKNALNVGIRVIKKEVDKYYGFEIDGNRRFLLGNFTVTHNTIMALNIISKIKRKTLIVVHKEFLLRQWVERIEEFLPGARVGRIQGEIVDIVDKDIVIGMLQSLSMKEYPTALFSSFGLTVYDEVHHMAAEVFSRALFKIVTKRMLGLSATMKRSDNLSKVFKMFIGPIVYTKKREGGDGVMVHAIDYVNNDEEFSKVELNFKGQVHYSKMIKKICEFNHRSEFILSVLENMLKDSLCNQIMILGHNKVLLKYLHDAVEHRKMASVGYYVGGMKEKDLKESETKKVVIATYAMASEGLDIKTLSSLIMATPKSSVEQCIGRILRTKHDRPLVVDIVDQHEFFNRQWLKRKRFYVKEKYKIKRTNNESYFKDEWVNIFDGKKKTKSYKQKIFKPEDLLKGVCLIDDDD
jgi:superfamily II DNA or RNA helicase